MDDMKLALDRLLDVLTGQGLSNEHAIAAMAIISFGAGAALLHPIIALVSAMYTAAAHVVAMPGVAIRRKRYAKYMEDRDKREAKKTLKYLDTEMTKCLASLQDTKKHKTSIGELHSRLNELQIRLNEFETSAGKRFDETLTKTLKEVDRWGTGLRAELTQTQTLQGCGGQCFTDPCAACPKSLAKFELKFDDDDETNETLQVIQLDDNLTDFRY